MKTFNQTLILSSILMIFITSCKKTPLTTYDTEDNVYFNYYRDSDPKVQRVGTPTDSVDYTFAYSSPDLKSFTIPIPIAVTGTPKNFDREINLMLDPASTTAAAKHFELPASFKMRAGRVVDTIFIKLNRTADLQDKPVSLVLKLGANKNFVTQLEYRAKSPGATIIENVRLLSFKVLLSDIFAPAPSWGTTYFGVFSLKKVRLMNEITAMPLSFWSVVNVTFENRSNLASYYAAFMSRYLQNQALGGHTIFEDDGVTPMRMGSAYQ